MDWLPKTTSKAVLPICVLLASMHSQACAQEAAQKPSVEAGRQLYASYCARCHGLNMVNNGATFDLRSFPKDQRERFERSVSQGLRAMPAWGATLKPEDLQALWLFVSSGGGS
jgi:mono/diheme cytochrome c family protein